MSRPQGETRELTVVLTEAELVQAGADLCDAVQDADSYEAEMEEAKADWRAALKARKEELAHRRKVASEAAEVVRTGKAKRDVPCTWKHALDAGWAFLVRDDTGERIQSRKLKDEERQLTLGEPPFAEPTPEELADWLTNLPVNEEAELPEGHAETVTAEDQAVDLEQYEADDFSEGDICGVTIDHDVPKGHTECRRCGAELVGDGPYGDDVGIEDAQEVYDEEMQEDYDEGGEDTPVEDGSDELIDDAIEAGELVIPPLNHNPGIAELAAMPDAQAEALVKRSRAKR